MEPVTYTVWITRQITTVAHIEGLLEGLRAGGAVDLAAVKIMAIEPDRPVSMPHPKTGRPIALTYDNLPPQGLLFLADPA